MLRLSIVIPFRQNNQRLEDTLLSVLENRPAGSEIIVVHDGSYRDPYGLGDEVLFVQESPGCSSVQLLNAGVMAACSPVVCALLDGTRVDHDWAERPLAAFDDLRTTTVSVAIDYHQARSTSFGIDSRFFDRLRALRHGRAEATGESETCSGPALACGFYRRKVLLAVGGWNEALDESVADVELAIALKSLGLHCQSLPHTRVASSGSLVRRFSPAALSQLASVAVAHGAVAPGIVQSLKGLIADSLSGRVVSAMAWASGLRDTSTIRRTQMRLAHAKQQLASQAIPSSLKIFHVDSSSRLGSRKAA